LAEFSATERIPAALKVFKGKRDFTGQMTSLSPNQQKCHSIKWVN